ncbi:cysteine desulfurase family protein [Dendrosporobacter sp. 1207_IL3150]|uniref:cysteine desulfurase family protein n=1 Tax=Dendrosporobacter sp. 1207_IL3150 TaxID=3084054 RepID=UPI002FDAC686
MIYFDNSATTLPDEDILAAYHEMSTQYFGNPSSPHRLGAKAALKLEQARSVCADSLGVRPEEIIFTSSGSESNNTIIKGLAIRNDLHGKHIITTSVEHASVYETCKQLESMGYFITYLPTDDKGCINLDDVIRNIRKDTILVTVMYVNSELGSIQPIADIGRLLSAFPTIHFHVDAVQGFGKLPLSPKEWGIDSLAISAHKFHGLRGAGLLYVRSGTSFSPLVNGGGQEYGYRAGTENVPCIVAMSKAMHKQNLQQEDNYKYLSNLKKYLIDGLMEIPGCILNSPQIHSEVGAPHIVNFSLPGLSSKEILFSLESEAIYVSKSSACSSKSNKPSRVLLSAGISEDLANSAIRVSFSTYNTIKEIDSFLLILQMIIAKSMLKYQIKQNLI